MLTQSDYATLIDDARRKGDDELARDLANEYNYMRAEQCASKERARQRTIARKRESAWMAGVEAQTTGATLPAGLSCYEQRAWRAGVGGFEFSSIAD